MNKKILTIAGSDPFAGGGLQADIKTFEDYSIFGLSALTCIAVLENHEFIVHDIEPQLLESQLKTIFENVALDGIKIGLIHNLDSLQILKDYLQNLDIPIVLDPVLAFKETDDVYNQEYVHAIKKLFPLVDIITPNLKEAELLTGDNIATLAELAAAGEKLFAMGAKSVVIKGGDRFPGDTAYDLFYDGNPHLLAKPKLSSININGAGCTFASAITSHLVLNYEMYDAIIKSKAFVYHAIENGIEINRTAGNVWSGGCRKLEVE